ncbi:amyloid-beta A4 precursor protein-binding family A member 3 [Syngnathoides biaculeatus]|uniref:amyloid-beta A4 precursor protein-binding family A member 3 n=1 Tax=Syngnathoides biaculeatus TaxID=300417 RepID=UPI002ADE018E|nr:amyloid-beta A4 precursor protein-binding family A member 3 [Syngnathoides biaculeatus]XP_061682036.1 amyloid-beta A4 precursor protein-binding family A member 3 [Syngnathoides biaculeatus]
MDADHGSLNVPPPAPSDMHTLTSFDGESDVMALNSGVLELDPYRMIEPPPLDWNSDSSTEAASTEELDDANFLSTPGSGDPDVNGTVASPDVNRQELEAKNTELKKESAVEEDDRREPTIYANDADVDVEDEEANQDQGDEDHTRIQTLLCRLQLKGKEAHPHPRTAPCSDEHPHSGLYDPKACASLSTSLEDSTETTGLLFSESHQRDVLGLLQCTDISATPQPGCHPLTGEMDAVVSVSYNQEDAQSFWGLYGNSLQEQYRDNSVKLLPDSGCPQPVRVKLEEEDPGEEASAESEQNADDHPSYKDVPGPCDPEDLLDGVIFGAKYLGSTQLKSEKNPSTNARMAQAQEAVDRIKAPEGETQPMTEVDLFVSTQRIKVLSADTQEAMMDHSLQMISYIADIGDIVVLMARRKRKAHESASSSSSPSSSSKPQKCLMICHVFSSVDAQIIAQAIGQAFGVAYQQFLQASGIKASDLRPGEYSDYLESQELYNGDLAHFSDSQNIREVAITKAPGEILGLAVVESGWGSIVPTVMVANLLHGGPAERCGELSIGDRIMSVNGTSLVGLPITTCQNIIQDLKSQKYVKISIVHCPPVTMAIIRRPDPKYQLGFSVEDGIICSLMRGGIAERGGIRVGHRIIEINGQSVVATPHDKIIQILTNAVGEIHMKTMPSSTYRLLTGQEQPVFL